MTRDLMEDEDLREALCDWLRANDVDPHTVPADERPSLADGQLTLRQFVYDERGRTLMVPNDEYLPLTRVITVPVRTAPPPLIEEWLAPRCPTCGR